MNKTIYHIAELETWKRAEVTGEYVVESLIKEGFIHCSFPRQIVFLANNKFKVKKDLLLLCIDRAKLNCNVIDEDIGNQNDLYPHIYGPIPIESVF